MEVDDWNYEMFVKVMDWPTDIAIPRPMLRTWLIIGHISAWQHTEIKTFL